MATYNTPYKSGTFSGSPVSGALTFDIAGFTPVQSDVGRIIVVTSGNALLQHREILAVSGQTITISHGWDVSNFFDPTDDQRASDVLPSSGDSFSISYDMDDLQSTDTDITVHSPDVLELTSGALSVSGGAYIHFKKKTLRFDALDIRISNGGGMIFGYYGYVPPKDGVVQDAYVKQNCYLYDTVTSQNGMNGTSGGADDFGLLDMYGATIRQEFAGESFWRCYGNDPANTIQNRWINCTSVGNLGSRTEGNRSILILKGNDNTSTIGLTNPLSSVARTEFSAFDSTQAVYVNPQLSGPNGLLKITQSLNLSRAVRFTGKGGAGLWGFECNIDEIDSLDSVMVANSTSSSQIVQFGNFFKPKFVNQDTSLFSNPLRVTLEDVTNTLTDTLTISDGGSFPRTFKRYQEALLGGSFTWATPVTSRGTTYGSYTLRCYAYGQQILSQQVTGRSEFTSSLTLLPDSDIILTKTQAQALTSASNHDELQAAQSLWLENNGTDQDQKLISATGDAGSYNVTIDATAASVFAFDGTTITIKATTFTGNITTTGTVSFANGATIQGGIIDINGDSFLTFTNEWEVYATETDRNNSTNIIESGTSTDNFRFTFSAGTTYYLWVAGTKQKITPAQSGETKFDLSTATLLVQTNASLSYIPRVIYVDTTLVNNGEGTNSSPYNNIDDAEALFQQGGYNYISIKSTIAQPAIPTASLSGTKLKGVDKFSAININGQSLEGATIENMLVYGTQSASDINGVIIENSRIIGDYLNFKGIFKEGEVLSPTGADITISVHTQGTFLDSSIVSGGDVTFDLASSGFFGIRGSNGICKISNMTTGTASFEVQSGEIELLSTCTGGAIRFNDGLKVVDNSLGTTTETSSVILLNASGLDSSELHTALDSYSNKDNWKADVSNLPALELQAIAQAVRSELSSELGDIGVARDHAAAANIQTKKL